SHFHRERLLEDLRDDRLAPGLWRRTGGSRARDGTAAGAKLAESVIGEPGRRGGGAEWTAGHRARALRDLPGATRRAGEAPEGDPGARLRPARGRVLCLRLLRRVAGQAHAAGEDTRKRRRRHYFPARHGTPRA